MANLTPMDHDYDKLESILPERDSTQFTAVLAKRVFRRFISNYQLTFNNF